MDLKKWFSDTVGSVATKVGNFASEQLSNAGRGLKDGFTGSSGNPGGPDADKPFLEDITEGLAGGVKGNWGKILTSLVTMFGANRLLGKLIPDGWPTLVFTAFVGLMTFGLIKHFRGANEDDSPAPKQKVNMPSVPGGTANKTGLESLEPALASGPGGMD